MRRRSILILWIIGSGCGRERGSRPSEKVQAVPSAGKPAAVENRCKRQYECMDSDAPVKSGSAPGVIRTATFPGGVGGPQGAWTEGWGLEGASYSMTDQDFNTDGSPKPKALLKIRDTVCGTDVPTELEIQHCEKGALGAFACLVDVKSHPRGLGICGYKDAAELPTGVTADDIGDADEQTTAGRGVILVRGAWNGEGDWRADKKPDDHYVTVSCDSKQNEKHQHGWADGSIANCVRAGYYPGTWKKRSAEDGDDQDLFLACIRAARADYCGDGTSFTSHGTNISMYDDDRSPNPAPKERAKRHRRSDRDECKEGRCFEAKWSRDGAEVFMSRRWAAKEGEEYDLPICPTGAANPQAKRPFKPRPAAGEPASRDKIKTALLITRGEINFCKPVTSDVGSLPNRKQCHASSTQPQCP